MAVDESGVGKSACSYISQMAREERYFGINQKHLFPVVITSGNKVDLLDNYYNRIQNGLEEFFYIPKEWEDEEFLKKLYVNALRRTDEDATKIIFSFEHMKFTRNQIKDPNTEIVKVVYKQSPLNFLHDDTINASMLASYIVKADPTITSMDTKISPISFNTASGRGWGSRF